MMDTGADSRDATRMPAIGTTTFSQLDAVLATHHPRLTTSQVHALFLGAQTSTSPRLLPQHLIGKIFGEDPAGPEVDMMALLQALFGYWNHLIERREAGEVALAPLALSEGATRDDLKEYAERRHGELIWYIRGIDAGGDDPIEFGEEGQAALKRIAEADGFLHAYADLLTRTPPESDSALAAARQNLLSIVESIEDLMATLMAISDEVRRAAMATFQANAGRRTDDGARIARPTKVPRNSPCPCGSGKKWKRCCGVAEQMH